MALTMALTGLSRASASLILSYVFDWLIICLMAGVGGLFSLIKENRRAFSLTDASISYPYDENETISTVTLVLVSLLAPAVIVAVISLLLVPGPTAPKTVPKILIWKRKLWELNTGWLGLACALAVAFVFTQGMKILFGSPRPDLLSRCKPDLDAVQNNIVGGFGQNLVDWHICTQTDNEILADGFMSFPSGHSSYSWAGLLYLTLFLCSKFAIAIPYLLPVSYTTVAFASRMKRSQPQSNDQVDHGHETNDATAERLNSQERVLRSEAAAPPQYLLAMAIIPIGAAVYISSTRFTNYRHHAFDILFGSFIGILSAYLGFRWYHTPIRRGAGWSWGPRSHERAWAIGVGVQGYAGASTWKRDDEADLERGDGSRTPPSEPDGHPPGEQK